MTLTEYLNQSNPIKMPNVILAEREYKIGLKISLPNNESITQIFIPAVNTYYIQKNGDTVLFTCDKDGNPKAKSCFNIDFYPLNAQEITAITHHLTYNVMPVIEQATIDHIIKEINSVRTRTKMLNDNIGANSVTIGEMIEDLKLEKYI